MQTFLYTARDLKTGEKISAEVEAQDQLAASKLLSERGLAPLEITAKDEAKGGSMLRRGKVASKNLVVFSRQLSTLVNAGLPLVQSLEAVRNQTTDKNLRPILDRIINDVEAGTSLAQAMALHPRVFNEVYVSLIAAGETSGTLDKSLERLANQQEKDAEILSRIRGALLYPIIIIVVLIGVVIFLMTSVLPQVQSLYAGLPGVKLPFITTVLIGVANFILNYWWLIIIVLAAGSFLIVRWSRTPSGRSALDSFKMRAPAIGPLFMKLYMARFARISSTLVASGVPLIQVLTTSSKSIGNVHLEKSILRAAESVKDGKALSESLKAEEHILDLVPNMVRTGEQSGTLDSMLAKLADYYEREVDNQVRSISTVIEPLMMVVVGIIALIIVAAVLLPIYSLAGKNFVKV